ncbi:MAG: Transcriptional activator of maltose regulon, MalT, partial [uncultured Chloroflexia bacterium]
GNHHRKVAWLSLDAGDSNPIMFLRYLIAALQTTAPDVGATTAQLLQSPQALPAETLLPLLINDLVGLVEPTILVLDDYHIIDSPAVHQAVMFLLDHVPPQLHVVLASRADPPMALSRFRARGILNELRANDLRFTPDEAASFLQDVTGLNLSADEVTALEARTEGWIAGLQLAALSLRDRTGTERMEFIENFAGSHRFIVDYLIDEVLAHQPAHLQTFLLRTSILERLSGPLCDAVVLGEQGGGGQSAEKGGAAFSQILLQELERANLFIIPLDDARRWYRYHHLFAQVLRERLITGTSAETVATLHRNASGWFEEQGLIAEAVHHALAAQDWERVVRLI